MQVEFNYQELSEFILKTEGSIFVVSGKSFEYTGVAEKLSLSPDKYVRFSDFTENPKLEDVKKGVTAFKTSGAKHILAVGGGTAIDIAKLVKHYAYTDLQRASCGVPEAADLNLVGDIQLTVVPTTFGTGSESTHFAVMYVQGAKYSVAGPSLLPNSYLLDSSFSKTLPKEVKAATCLDALCQAIESYWSKGANEESERYASEAIQLIVKNYRKYVEVHGGVSDEIAVAANLAGKAINITKTTAPHALSYSLTSKFGVAHGHAVALCLRNVFQIHERKSVSPELNKKMQELYGLLSVNGCEEARNLIDHMMTVGGLEVSLVCLGVNTPNEIIEIVQSVNVERLSNHPVTLLESELKEMLFD